jgi:hypothetical protein
LENYEINFSRFTLLSEMFFKVHTKKIGLAASPITLVGIDVALPVEVIMGLDLCARSIG